MTDSETRPLDEFRRATVRLHEAKSAICTMMMVLENNPDMAVDRFEGVGTDFKAALDVYRDKLAVLYGRKRKV